MLDSQTTLEPRPAPTVHALSVLPHGRRDGFWASIRGHVLDLADPSCADTRAPTPDDLLIASIASELAWSARTILRAHALPEDVNVSAEWRTHDDPPSLAEVSITVAVSQAARPVSAALAAAFDRSLEVRSVGEVVHISLAMQ